jgi:hypothetical protein
MLTLNKQLSILHTVYTTQTFLNIVSEIYTFIAKSVNSDLKCLLTSIHFHPSLIRTGKAGPSFSIGSQSLSANVRLGCMHRILWTSIKSLMQQFHVGLPPYPGSHYVLYGLGGRGAKLTTAVKSLWERPKNVGICLKRQLKVVCEPWWHHQSIDI